MMLKSGALKKVEDFLKGFPVPVMSTSKVKNGVNCQIFLQRACGLLALRGPLWFQKGVGL